VDRLRKPTLDGRTELILTPLELLGRLAYLVTPVPMLEAANTMAQIHGHAVGCLQYRAKEMAML